jgi:hypothetical protein
VAAAASAEPGSPNDTGRGGIGGGDGESSGTFGVVLLTVLSKLSLRKSTVWRRLQVQLINLLSFKINE